MIKTLMALGLLLFVAERSRGEAPAGSAADRITLRDGSIVLGVVNATTPGPRGSVEILVRRDWAEKAVKSARSNGTVPAPRASGWRSSSGGSGSRRGGWIGHRMRKATIASFRGSIGNSHGLPARPRPSRF